MEESAPGLVLGAKGFSGGNAGVDCSEERPAALWGGVETDELVVDRKAIGDGALADGVECRSAGSFNEEKLTLGTPQYTISHWGCADLADRG